MFNKRAVACSATAYGEYCGTRTTLILPRCSKSTLLKPAHLRAISFIPYSFNFSKVFLSAISLTKMQTTSKPLASWTVSAFQMNNFYYILQRILYHNLLYQKKQF